MAARETPLERLRSPERWHVMPSDAAARRRRRREEREQQRQQRNHQARAPVRAPARPQGVLEEEEFVGAIEHIVKRDFFPEMAEIDAARQRGAHGDGDGDVYGHFEAGDESAAAAERHARLAEEAEGGLDAFARKFTSEDNVALHEGMMKDREAFRRRHWWAFEEEGDGGTGKGKGKGRGKNAARLLAIEDAKELRSGRVETWRYRARNSLLLGAPSMETSKDICRVPKRQDQGNEEEEEGGAEEDNQEQEQEDDNDKAAPAAAAKEGKVAEEGTSTALVKYATKTKASPSRQTSTALVEKGSRTQSSGSGAVFVQPKALSREEMLRQLAARRNPLPRGKSNAPPPPPPPAATAPDRRAGLQPQNTRLPSDGFLVNFLRSGLTPSSQLLDSVSEVDYAESEIESVSSGYGRRSPGGTMYPFVSMDATPAAASAAAAASVASDTASHIEFRLQGKSKREELAEQAEVLQRKRKKKRAEADRTPQVQHQQQQQQQQLLSYSSLPVGRKHMRILTPAGRALAQQQQQQRQQQQAELLQAASSTRRRHRRGAAASPAPSTSTAASHSTVNVRPVPRRAGLTDNLPLR